MLIPIAPASITLRTVETTSFGERPNPPTMSALRGTERARAILRVAATNSSRSIASPSG